MTNTDNDKEHMSIDYSDQNATHYCLMIYIRNKTDYT